MSSNTILTYMSEGLKASLPATPTGVPSTGSAPLYWATDTAELFFWNGSAWVEVVGGLTALTGDVTASGYGSKAATLATVNSDVGSFTSANITVDAKGRITAAANGSSAGGTLTITDGTNSVAATTNLTMGGGLIGGSTPNATWTPPSLNVDAITITGATQTLTPGTLIGKYAITLQHNVTFTMSGGTDGMVVLLELIQDSTGSRTVAFDSTVVFGTDLTSFTATTTASAVDYVLLQYSANLSKWCFLSYSRGF